MTFSFVLLLEGVGNGRRRQEEERGGMAAVRLPSLTFLPVHNSVENFWQSNGSEVMLDIVGIV